MKNPALRADGSRWPRPRGVHVFAEEAAGIAMQVIAVGAEVVVDHIENHRQTVTVGGVDQVFELVG